MKKQLLILFIMLAFLNAQVLIRQNEDFDPATLNEPPVSMMNTSDIYEIISDVHGYTFGNLAGNEMRTMEMQGWKIQLYSTKNFYEADSIKNLADQAFPNEEVISVFNSPYYKIRMGNCKNRNEAEYLLEEAKRRQFHNAWIIPSRVMVEERTSINK
ncbi:MAG: SPOR domain-containing protein [Candidatus Marinimicrobia bacterium]|nr:SPOR domain-containing protein [Candidatus Neomarinimicrobiota bacterium]